MSFDDWARENFLFPDTDRYENAQLAWAESQRNAIDEVMDVFDDVDDESEAANIFRSAVAAIRKRG